MSDLTSLFEAIGDLANTLFEAGEKITFSQANLRLGKPRKSSRPLAGDMSRSFDYFTAKGDHSTAHKIADVFTNKNGDAAWLSKYGWKKSKK